MNSWLMMNSWRVKTCPDTGAFFAELRNPRLEVVWRSLTTKDPDRARQWMESARCHGVREHWLTCKDCEGGKQRAPGR
jgi:hypothetical protein